MGSIIPDAILQNITAAPATIQAGQNTTITCLASNTSSFSLAYNMAIQYFISTDQIIDAGDWSSGQEIVNLNPGQSQTVSHVVTVPINYSGNYYILLKIDATNQVTESNENNNEGNVAVNIVASLPDLIIQSLNIAPSTTFQSGATLNITGTIQNNGLAAENYLNGSCKLYLSQDNVLDKFDHKLSYVLGCSAGSLNVNQTAAVGNANVVIPSNLASGNWYLIASVDNDIFADPTTGMNAESNESNNTFSVSVLLSNPNQPTVQVSNVSLTNITSTSLRVNWTSGNGNKRIVTVKQNNIPDFPVDNTTYTGNGDYASAPVISGTSTKVLFTGTGNYVDVINLLPNTDYTFTVLEYNDIGTTKDYLQASNLRGIMTHTPSNTSNNTGWTIQDNTYAIYGLQFMNDTVGYGLMGTNFAKTNNGGTTWQLYEIIRNNTEVQNAFHFVNINEGILSIPNGNIYKTTNGGNTWTQVSNANNRFVNKVQMLNSSLIYLACAGVNNVNNGAVLKSVDGGVTWTTVHTAPARIELMHFTSSNIGWAVGTDKTIYKTSDGGITWNTQTILNNCGYNYNDMSFVDDNTGWLINMCGDIYKTVNGGSTWNLQTTQGGGIGYPKLSFLDANTGIYLLPPNVKLTLNGGNTWTSLPNSSTISFSSPMYLSVRSSNNIWAGGSNALYKTTTGGDTSGITLAGINPGFPCLGDSIHVSYSFSGTYHSSNVAKLELSDSLGQFSNPVVLSSNASVSNGILNAVLPANITRSSYYKLRIATTNPVTYSNASAPLSLASNQTLSITNLQNSYSTQQASFALSGLPSGGNFFIDNNPATIFDPALLVPGNHIVSYQYGIGGCTYSVHYNVNIFEPLSIDLQSLTANTVCAGGNISVPFIAKGIFDSTNIFTAQLSDNAGSFSNAIDLASMNGNHSDTMHIAIPANMTSGTGYKLRMISAYANVISDTLVLSVNSALMPSATIVTGDTLICSGTNAVFNITGSNLGTAPGYQWLLNGIGVGTNNPSYTTSALVDGDVMVKVTSNVACPAQTEIFTSTKTIVVVAKPDTPTIAQFDSILVSSSPVGNQWYLNGNILTGETNQFITATQNGSYSVIVSVSPCDSVVSQPYSYNTNPLLMPVSSFGGNANKCEVSIHWQSGVQSAIQSFILERSEDGNSFKSIATIAVKHEGRYEYKDIANSNTYQHYRLKIINKDGSYQYSQTLSVCNSLSIQILQKTTSP